MKVSGRQVMKLFAAACALFSLLIAIPAQAQSIVGGGEIRAVQQDGSFVQRIYNKGGLAFMYTHDITYHFDSTHVVTARVEHGTNASAYGSQLAATQGINISSYTPSGTSGAWALVGWKNNDGSANATGVNNNIVSSSTTDLYAVWAKDCTSYFNFNGGSAAVTWGSFSSADWYARGNAYYNSGNITPFRVQLPGVSRANYTLTSITNNGSGSYAQQGAYDLTDKSTFICNWKMNYKEEAVINTNPNWNGPSNVKCYGDLVLPTNAAIIKIRWITNTNSFSYTRGYGLTCAVNPTFTGAEVQRGGSYFVGQINGNQVYEGIWYVCTPGQVIIHNDPVCGTMNDLATIDIWYKY